MSEKRIEFRPRSNGEFDEIVARFADGTVHVETMSGTGCYVGFYWDDGRQLQWWINSTRKLTYHHEESRDPPSVALKADAHAEGYAQAERDIVAWLRQNAVVLTAAVPELIADRITQGAHRTDTGDQGHE